MWQLRTALASVFIGIALCEAMAACDADWHLPLLNVIQPRKGMQSFSAVYPQPLLHEARPQPVSLAFPTLKLISTTSYPQLESEGIHLPSIHGLPNNPTDGLSIPPSSPPDGSFLLVPKPKHFAIHKSVLEEREQEKKDSVTDIQRLSDLRAQDLENEIKDVFKKFSELKGGDLKKEDVYFRVFIGLSTVSKERRARIAYNMLANNMSLRERSYDVRNLIEDSNVSWETRAKLTTLMLVRGLIKVWEDYVTRLCLGRTDVAHETQAKLVIEMLRRYIDLGEKAWIIPVLMEDSKVSETTKNILKDLSKSL